MTNHCGTCLFCESNGPFRSVSHIVPESLGGARAPVASAETTCDACNQYFGQKVEAAALATFPFGTYRLFSSMPSKKGRMYSQLTTLGMTTAAGTPGQLNIEVPNERVRERLLSSATGQVRILAEVTEPLAVCRMLLKIGLELLAKEHPDIARSQRFAAARTFCRKPRRGDKWWFSLHTDPTLILTVLRSGEETSCELEVREVKGCACGILRLDGLASIVPLEQNAVPPRFSKNEHAHRTVWAAC